MSDTIGFKEWALICELLGSGDQILILRKGGIAEGRDGFQFKHPGFFLFPAHFHGQGNFLQPDFVAGRDFPDIADKERETITIEYQAEVVETRVITDWEEAVALDGQHAWTEETVKQRFDYDEAPGISVAYVRVYRLAAPWTFANERGFGGCRSWVKLPDCPQELLQGKVPVLGDEAFAAMMAS